MNATTTDESNTRRQPRVLLRTVHGSRLYGLAHADSDDDNYFVVDQGTRRAKQTIVGKDDITVLTLAEFAHQIHKGVPQALEALFSPAGDALDLDAYRHHFYVDTAACLNTYRRTIKSFSLAGDFKRRRHALRLAYNLRDLAADGRFNPRLTERTAQALTASAQGGFDGFLADLLAVSPVDPFEGKYRDEDLTKLAATFAASGGA